MKLIRTYIVLALALLITVSATGISISLHKCCGSIKDFSFLGHAEECDMAKKPVRLKCPIESENTITKNSCCSDQEISLSQASEKLPAAKIQIKEKEQNFNVLFVYTLFNKWFDSSDEEKESGKPSPGIFIIEALVLLLQQFRI